MSQFDQAGLFAGLLGILGLVLVITYLILFREKKAALNKKQSKQEVKIKKK